MASLAAWQGLSLKKTGRFSVNRVGKDQYGCYLISSTGETFQPRVRGLNTQKEGEKGQLLCQLGCPFPPSPPVSNNLGKGVLHAAFTHMDTDTHTHFTHPFTLTHPAWQTVCTGKLSLHMLSARASCCAGAAHHWSPPCLVWRPLTIWTTCEKMFS